MTVISVLITFSSTFFFWVFQGEKDEVVKHLHPQWPRPTVPACCCCQWNWWWETPLVHFIDSAVGEPRFADSCSQEILVNSYFDPLHLLWMAGLSGCQKHRYWIIVINGLDNDSCKFTLSQEMNQMFGFADFIPCAWPKFMLMVLRKRHWTWIEAEIICGLRPR